MSLQKHFDVLRQIKKILKRKNKKMVGQWFEDKQPAPAPGNYLRIMGSRGGKHPVHKTFQGPPNKYPCILTDEPVWPPVAHAKISNLEWFSYAYIKRHYVRV